jgi:hypothetical protein
MSRPTAGTQNWWRIIFVRPAGARRSRTVRRFQPDGKWDGETRWCAVNARLSDNFDPTGAPGHRDRRQELW